MARKKLISIAALLLRVVKHFTFIKMHVSCLSVDALISRCYYRVLIFLSTVYQRVKNEYEKLKKQACDI